MEYVFGTLDGKEVVSTKGDSHSNLNGFCEIEREYPESTITDRFRVVRRQWTAEDSIGNCYDRYEIDSHYRIIDRSKYTDKQVEQVRADMDFIAMMTDVDLMGDEEV